MIARRSRARSALTAACALVLLAGCTARTDAGLTGAAPAGVEHLWITVEEVWFASAADTPTGSATDWVRERLSGPVVLDLADLETGRLVPLVTGVSLPAGRYRQLHLGIADAGDRLLDEAGAAGLEYNAQVDVRDQDGSITRAPLELPVPGAGITIPVDFRVEGTDDRAGGDEEVVQLGITLDAARDVLTYGYGSATGYLLSPGTSVLDAAAAGEIRGRVDTGALVAGHAAVTASAQRLDDSGTHRVMVQRRAVAADGTFSLYPLPAGGDGATYDVVISCADASTVVVRDVPVSAASAATTLQTEPIALVPATSVHADTDGAAAGLPAGTRVEFFQTLPGRDERPYLVDGTALDPLARRLPGKAFALSAGPLVVGTYTDGAAIEFGTVVPSPRAGAYIVGSAGPYREATLAAESVDVSGSEDRPTRVAVPYPGFAGSGRAGRLTLSVQSPAGRYDRGFVTVVAGGRLVEAAAVDELLARGGGLVLVEGLPSGSALAPDAGVSYRAALRAWSSRDPAGTMRRVASTASVSLGDGGAGALQLEVR
jgi:hypothetical protein